MSSEPALDLAAYLRRVGLAPPLPPTLATLERLHVAHLGAIPFSNLEVRLRRPVPLDLPSLERRLVHERRGGYCFEQNTLFAAALRALGFQVETLEARVRPADAPAPLPRTHMLLRVTVEGGDVLADVGFGGDGPLVPVPLDGRTVEEPGDGQPGDVFRVHAESEAVRVLQRRAQGRWVDLYGFTLAPAFPVDYEVAHHYTSTHPRSIFVNTLTAQRTTPAGRHVLRGAIYTFRQGETSIPRRVEAAEAARIVRDEIGIAASDEEVAEALR